MMAEAPLVIDPAVAKSNAADMSFGLINRAFLSPANRCPDRLAVAASSKAASTAPIRRSELDKVAIQIASALVAEQDDTWVGS
jgi:hypothetical protein